MTMTEAQSQDNSGQTPECPGLQKPTGGHESTKAPKIILEEKWKKYPANQESNSNN